ncbi:hypothetical protein BBD46_19290 [Natrialba sp. SSL1]|nr:hypothetical protein BBD46_19290 [Natrialba sp. SSL1]
MVLSQTRGTWWQSELLALVFESAIGAEPGVVVDVDGDLRYRERDTDQWYEITNDGLQNYLTQRG